MSRRLRMVFAVSIVLLGLGRLWDWRHEPVLAAGKEAKAESPADWKTILTAADIETILRPIREEVQGATSSSSKFRRGAAAVERLANRVIVLGNAGTLVLEGGSAGKAAALREAGIALAKAATAKDHAAAQKAAETIASYPAAIEPAANAKPVPFVDLIELNPLMLIVNQIEDEMTKLDMASPEAFAAAAKASAASAMLLATVSLASAEYEADADWDSWCREMMRSSITLSKSYSGGDQATAKTAYQAMQKSCRDCHKANGIED